MKAKKYTLSDVYRNAFEIFKDKNILCILALSFLAFLILLVPLQVAANRVHSFSAALFSIHNITSFNVTNSSFSYSISNSSSNVSAKLITKYIINRTALIPALIVFGKSVGGILAPTSLLPLSFMLVSIGAILLFVITVLYLDKRSFEFTLTSFLAVIINSVILNLFVFIPLLYVVFFGFGLISISFAGLLISILGILAIIYLLTRLILYPVYSALSRNPIEAIEQTFEKSKNKFWFMFGSFVIPTLLIVIVINLIFWILAVALYPAAFVFISLGVSISTMIFAALEYYFTKLIHG